MDSNQHQLLVLLARMGKALDPAFNTRRFYLDAEAALKAAKVKAA
jgi:hypothetical protein